MDDALPEAESLDPLTEAIIDALFTPPDTPPETPKELLSATAEEADGRVKKAESEPLTAPIIDCFSWFQKTRSSSGLTPGDLGVDRERLTRLARKHAAVDEHGVTVGGRLGQALSIVAAANARVESYLDAAAKEAPSGIELWPMVQENAERIRRVLGMREDDWNTYSGQIRHCIDSADTLAKVANLPASVVAEVLRVTRSYRMRLTPYYASLIRPGVTNDPILLQSVPTSEMVDNVGVEIPPVAADHSPARLVDQFYPRVVTIKSTNMCAMYCTHCLRIAHIGKRDRIYTDAAYAEALAYIRDNPLIRDVLITGGDAFVLPNAVIKKILGALDDIDHVRLKRLGSRIPVTAPQRIDSELLDILSESNERKPVRVVTQINTAQEITPVSKSAFRAISNRVSAVLNQAVLLRGINDTRVKMWKLCETIQESYVRPYYVFNCSYRNPQFSHFRVPVAVGRDIVESMYGNISGDAIPRYIATAGGKIPLHRSNVVTEDGGDVLLKKPWSDETVRYPDADAETYASPAFSFGKETS
jgi:KamA family protein